MVESLFELGSFTRIVMLEVVVSESYGQQLELCRSGELFVAMVRELNKKLAQLRVKAAPKG